MRIMFKKRGLKAATAAILIAVVLFGSVSASAQPGDAADPLVSKSYVDGQIDQLRSIMATGGSSSVSQADRDAIVAEVLIYFETVYGDLLRQATNTQPQAGEVVPYEAVFAEKGRTLVALSGTEIILRGGSATAVTGVNGLCDVTVGADITNNMNIPLNHLLIVPASDGRGMRFTADAYLMIKGGYYFVN